MILETRAVPPFMKNGYVLGCDATRQGVVIDPGDDVDLLLAAVAEHRLTPAAILLTHAHLDHITGVARARAALDVPVWLHEADNPLYENVVQQGAMFGFRVDPQPAVDHFYRDGQVIEVGRLSLTVRHTPGHCPGGVCLALAGAPQVLFVGDTLFAGSIGRTDLPGGDTATLVSSIREVLYAYPDDTIVLSGHGEPTTIGREKRTNPFVRAGGG